MNTSFFRRHNLETKSKFPDNEIGYHKKYPWITVSYQQENLGNSDTHQNLANNAYNLWMIKLDLTNKYFVRILTPKSIKIVLWNSASICIRILFVIITYHDFLPTPRRGSHVKSGKTQTHTVIKIHPLAHILDSWALMFSSCALFTVYPNRIM